MSATATTYKQSNAIIINNKNWRKTTLWETQTTHDQKISDGSKT